MAAQDDKKGSEDVGFAAFCLFSLSFCLYALSSSAAIGWLDSPEFVAQAASLGVAHSPGHPLPALLGRLASLLPVGDLVWRINLMSSACAAAAVTLLYAGNLALLGQLTPELSLRSRRALAFIVALLAGLAWALWSSAVRAEVYALQALLSAGALYALLRYESERRPRYLLLASFLLALGLANHHFMTLLILAPASVFVLAHKSRPSLPLSAWTLGMGLLGLMALAYLPIRSLAHPEVNFGAPHTIGRFLWTISGAAFAGSAQAEHVSTPLMDALQILVALNDALSLPLFMLALAGTYVCLRDAKTRRLGLLLAGIAVMSGAARVLLGFDPETPDHHAYLLPAIFALLLLALAAIAMLCQAALVAKRPLPKAPALACVAMSLFVPIALAANWQRTSQAGAWASDDFAHWEIDKLEPNSLVLLAYFQSSFRLWALRTVEGARPDLAILDRSFLTYPGMASEAKLRYPELASLVDAPLRAGAPTPIALLQEIANERPVFAQLHPNVDQALASTLWPAGAFARFAKAPTGQFQTDLHARQDLAGLLRHAGSAERELAKGALLWHDATRLSQLCSLGQHAAAARVYADARALAPSDQMLSEMARACGLEQEIPAPGQP